MRKRQGYEGVVLAAPFTVPYVRYSIHSAHWFLAQALAGSLKRAGLEKSAVDGLAVASFSLIPDSAIGLTQHLGLCVRWLDHVPFGGAAGIVSLRRAARAVQAGDAEIVACIAGDTNSTDAFRQSTANFSVFSRDAVYPYGSGGPNASFAFLTAHYMRRYGATAADFGKLCVAQRDNALKFPHALFKKKLTLEEYLDSRPIADPIRLFDCVMPCAGGESFLVMREETATALKLPFARLLGLIERHNAFSGDPIQERGGWAMDRDELYGPAGAAPLDVDFLQTYDDYPVISFLQIEDLGFCGKGEAKEFVRQHGLTVDGSFPINTSGGQLSVGQAGAAGGTLGLVDAVRQLTREPLGGAVAKPGLAVVSGFGMINYDRGLATGAALLAAG